MYKKIIKQIEETAKQTTDEKQQKRLQYLLQKLDKIAKDTMLMLKHLQKTREHIDESDFIYYKNKLDDIHKCVKRLQ